MYSPRHSRWATDGRMGFFLHSLVVYTVDQLSKWLVVANIGYLQSVPVIPGFFHLTHILNNGASFGLLRDRVGLFIWITGFALAFILWLVFFWNGATKPIRLLLGLVAGGALGNLSDRMRYGAVVDFLDFRGIWAYIFNVADIAVVCGGILLGIVLLLDSAGEAIRKPRH